MKYNKTLALIPALLLAACGGDNQSIDEPASGGAVIYSYPTDGQSGVSPQSDTVLRFSHPVTESESELQDKIEITANGSAVPFSVEIIDGGRSLRMNFETALEPATDYSLIFNEPLMAEGGRTLETPDAQGDPGVQFRTRGSLTGLAPITNQSDSFEVLSKVPSAEGDFQAMNFSTFRLAMTQPIHPDWEELGGSIELLDSDGQPVPATLLVKGDRIALDPCVTEDPLDCGSSEDILSSGEEYTLSIENLASLTDPSEANRFSDEWTFTPPRHRPDRGASAIGGGFRAGLGRRRGRGNPVHTQRPDH